MSSFAQMVEGSEAYPFALSSMDGSTVDPVKDPPS